MCSSGSFGRAACASIRTVELSTSEHDYYYDIRYNSMVSLNYSLWIPEGRVPSAVRNRHREQHSPHAAEGHRRCLPPVPHADWVHPERVRPEDGRVERAGFRALPIVRRVPPGSDGQRVDGGTARREAEDDESNDLPPHQQAQGDGPLGRGERERARDDPEGIPDPIRKSFEGVELRRIERRDRHGKLPQDGRPSREARGAAEVRSLADDIVSLTKGSRYRIESMETRERTKVTKGVFRGYATIGTDDAVVIELDDSHQELKGKLRLIPLHVVLAVDVLEHVPGEAPKVETHGTMYGWHRPCTKGSCPNARCLFHDSAGNCSGDSAAARLAWPRVPCGVAVFDFPTSANLSDGDRGRVRPLHPGSEAGPRDHLRTRSDRVVRRSHGGALEGESRGRGFGISNSRTRSRRRRDRVALPL